VQTADTAAPSATPDLQAAQIRVQRLDALLQEEFEALRTQSFDRTESLQADKVALLESLQATARQVDALPEPPAAWHEVIDILARCRTSHRRNELLITRQIEVVGATLRSLQLTEPADSVDLYDRMGHVARRGGRRAYSEA
jgi:flagellar biosynthesis/type III secretory pathway chaperone